MKKIGIFLIILFYSALNLVASNYYSPTGRTGEKTKNTKADTIASQVNDQERIMDVNDSILYFPAYDVYCEWDTVSIHPEKYDVCYIDSVNVLLNDEKYCGYAHPYNGNKSSDFGYRRGKGHYGVDINLETGDPVVAAFEGRVRIAKRNRTYGNVVVIRHNNGLETFYAHLSKLKVQQGQLVDAGELIGLGGNTGHSYGSHLHFEVRYMGVPLNPNNFISFDDKKLMSDSYLITKADFDYLNKAAAKKSSMYKKNKYKYIVQPKGSNPITIPVTLFTTSKATSPVPKTKASTAPANTKTVSAKAGSRTYVVKKGDTLYNIAKRYGTTTGNLCKLNGITSNTTLQVGRKIKI